MTTISPSTIAPNTLRRALGVGFGIAVGVGSMIGAGILRAPADVASKLPTPLLFIFIWVLGGAYALLGANALSELAVMLPRSGGQYVFAQRAFGPYAGFVVGWSDWLSSSASVAAISILFGESVAGLLGISPRVATTIAVAAAIVAGLVLARGVRAGDRAQRLTSAFKALAIIALVAACFLIAPRHPVSAPSPNVITAAAFVLALQGVIYAYDGWTGVMYFSEEVRDPGREIPRAAFGGVLAVIALYVAVNAAFLHVLPIDTMARSSLPAADVAGALAGGAGATLVRLLVALVLPSAIIANTLLASRVAYALGRDGGAPPRLAAVSGAGVPLPGLAISVVTSVLFIASGTFERVINVCAFLFVAAYVVSFAAVFVLRHREPALPRPYRAWGHPWTTGLVLLGSIVFLVGVVAADPRGASLALLLVVVSPLLFYAMRRTGLVAR
jgi:APA family basic amino acid/polyamine antiporter